MALRIDYFRNGEKVMASVYLRSVEEAKAEALTSLTRLAADSATILDTNRGGAVVGKVTRAPLDRPTGPT
jgi:hypothetical protein